MTDWERAQNLVATATGGKVTPGSGNGHQKGDVVTDTWMFEVKQTSGSSMTIQRNWLDKLVKEAGNKECALVIFFELRGYVYFRTTESSLLNLEEWKSVTVLEDSLPICLSYDTGLWKLGEWKELTELK